MSQISFINKNGWHKEEIESDIKEVATGALDSDWSPPASFPDHYKEAKVSIDLETHDPNLMTLGPGWAKTTAILLDTLLSTASVGTTLSGMRVVVICQRRQWQVTSKK